MIDWTAYVTIIGWFAPFLLAAAFFGFEKWRPRYADNGRRIAWLNLRMGLMSLAMLIAATMTLHAPIVDIAYYLQIFSIAESSLPWLAQFVLSFLLIDALAFINHWAGHRFNWIWRLHRAHHSEECVTAATTLLHHPLETLWLFANMLAAYVFFGVTLDAIIAYTLAAALHGPLSHANIAYPKWLNAALGWAIVTPDLHRIHHSAKIEEEHSNYGVLLTIWDRLAGTLRMHADRPDDAFAMGLADMTLDRRKPFRSALKLPFL